MLKKSAFKVRQENSFDAYQRLQSAGQARLKNLIQTKQASDDPRTAWVARELVCAHNTRDLERAIRATNELMMRPQFYDGRVIRMWPVMVDFDEIELFIIKAHKENKMVMRDKIGCVGYEIRLEDFVALVEYQNQRSLEDPVVFSDNPFYAEMPEGAAIREPMVAPPVVTVDDILNDLATVSDCEYEAYRLRAAEKLGFRPAVLDKERKRRSRFLGFHHA